MRERSSLAFALLALRGLVRARGEHPRAGGDAGARAARKRAQALILGSPREAAAAVALAQREYGADLRAPLAAAPAERAALEAGAARRRAAARRR